MIRQGGRNDPMYVDDRLTPAARNARERNSTASARLALVLLVGALLVSTIPRLAPGVCWEDSGDLQTASAMLGIAHPPGYAGYVSLGYLLTRLPAVDPAYVINLACMLSGIVAIALCARLQISLGANAWLAATVCLVFAAHPEVWPQLIVPEVYMPSLALAAGVAAAMLAWGRTGRQRWLVLIAFMAGLLVANRPPFALTLPALAVVYCWLGRRQGMGWRGIWLRALPPLAVFTLPIAYCCAYVWLRDGPDNPYNYIESFRTNHVDLLPAADSGRARLERLIWLISARQYHGLFVTNIADVAGQVTDVIERLFVYPIALSFGIAGIATGGVVLAWRRCATSACLFAGLAAGALVYCCAYRVSGFAANLLPTLFAAAIFSGVCLSGVVMSGAPVRGPRVAQLMFAVACIWIVCSARDRSGAALDAGATRFVATVDLTRLPHGAVVFSEWRTSPPLSYAQHVLAWRPDIAIINADRNRWLAQATPYLDDGAKPGRAVFFVEIVDVPSPYTLTECGQLWELGNSRRRTRNLETDSAATPQ